MIHRRRQALLGASAAIVLSGCAGMRPAATDGGERRHDVLVHGAWHGHHNVMLTHPDRLAASLIALG